MLHSAETLSKKDRRAIPADPVRLETRHPFRIPFRYALSVGGIEDTPLLVLMATDLFGKGAGILTRTAIRDRDLLITSPCCTTT